MLIPNKHSGYQAGIRLYPGGGKGGSAPPPDPQLIAAQIKSMGIQDSAIESMLKNSETMLPLQKEQLQFGLDSAKKGYEQSQEDRSWMLTRREGLSGMQDTVVKDAKDFNSAERQGQLVNEAKADVSSGFTNAQSQLVRNIGRRGGNLSGNAAIAMQNQNAIAQGAASAGAANKARTAGRVEGYSLTDRASNALAGYPAMGMAATGAGAGFGMAGNGMTNSALTGMNSGASAAGGMAGQMGQNATGMWNAQQNAFSQGQANDAAGSAALGSAIGGIAMAV